MGSLERSLARRSKRAARRPRGGDARALADARGRGRLKNPAPSPVEVAMKSLRLLRRAKARG